MQALRNTPLMARLVLAWLVLAIGVAVASPLVKPGVMELVCSGAGAMKLLVADSDTGGTPAAGHTLDCPLCVGLGAPPPVARIPDEPMLPLAKAVQSIPSARIAALLAGPLPARGPPLPLSI